MAIIVLLYKADCIHRMGSWVALPFAQRLKTSRRYTPYVEGEHGVDAQVLENKLLTKRARKVLVGVSVPLNPTNLNSKMFNS